MNKKTILSLIASLSLSLFSTLTFASESTQPMKPINGNNSELENAMKECARSSGKDVQGRPDRVAFEKCMNSKGFKRPEPRSIGDSKQGNISQPGQQGMTSSFK